MARTEPVQVKYTKRLKAALCCFCYYQNLLNQLVLLQKGHREAIGSLLILRCIHSY